MENDGNLRQSHLIPYPCGIKSAYPRGKVRKALSFNIIHFDRWSLWESWNPKVLDKLSSSVIVQQPERNCFVCSHSLRVRAQISRNTDLMGPHPRRKDQDFVVVELKRSLLGMIPSHHLLTIYYPFTNHLLTIIYVIYTLSQSVLVLLKVSKAEQPPQTGTLSDKDSLVGWNTTGDQNSEQIAGW
jgi:hypothetical protein